MFADQHTPQDVYALHQGLLGFHDRMATLPAIFAGINGDNACGMMVMTDEDGNKKGYTCWKSGSHSFYDIEGDLSTCVTKAVSTDDGKMSNGLASLNPPSINGTQTLADTITTGDSGMTDEGFGAFDYGPLSINGSPPFGYWGHCGADSDYVYAARMHGSFASTRNNIVSTGSLDELSDKYTGDASGLAQAQAENPEWATRLGLFNGKVSVVYQYNMLHPLTTGVTDVNHAMCVSVYTHSGAHVWDVFYDIESKDVGGTDSGMLSAFGMTVLRGGIVSVGTPLPTFVWVNARTGKVMCRQTYTADKPAYVGALVTDGAQMVFPLSGKFLYKPEFFGPSNRFIHMQTPGGI